MNNDDNGEKPQWKIGHCQHTGYVSIFYMYNCQMTIFCIIWLYYHEPSCMVFPNKYPLFSVEPVNIARKVNTWFNFIGEIIKSKSFSFSIAIYFVRQSFCCKDNKYTPDNSVGVLYCLAKTHLTSSYKHTKDFITVYLLSFS